MREFEPSHPVGSPSVRPERGAAESKGALALVLALSLSACASTAPAAAPPLPSQLTIVYTADLGGYVEPCGCSRDQRGGLPRAAAVLAQIRAEGHPVLFLGGGDLLFEGAPAPEVREQEELKARAIAEALRKMGLAATLAGERDAAVGEAFARSTDLPFTRAVRLGAVGFGALGAVPAAPVKIAVLHAGGTRAALERAADARADGVALLLASHRDSLLEDDANRALLDAPVPVVQVQGRGQSLARIDLFLRGDLSRGFTALTGAAQRDAEVDLADERRLEYGKRREAALAAGQVDLARVLASKMAELEARAKALRSEPLPEPPPDRPSLRVSFVPLVESLPEDRAVRAVVTRYYGEVARKNLARARAEGRPCPDPAKDAPTYVGTDAAPPGGTRACQMCHVTAYEQWKATPHARAYDTLARGGRQYDLDCIACHVTGWREAGGACNVAATAGREDVQCESCHGPASLHAIDPPGHIVRSPPPARCVTCHTPENSTQFEYGSYLKRILGPGHGAPAR
ncbi:MAG: multiheme c-type cytochrome [Anaeromyxobacteraceae bacterium]